MEILSSPGDLQEEAPDTSPADGSGEMFDAIAERYDRLNRVLSLGIDRSWRRKAVAALNLAQGAEASVLDLATGTADLALEILRRHPGCRVTGLDPSTGMLAIGRRKAREAGSSDRLILQEGNAEDLPYEDESFDGTTIAFGIRNVPNRPRALAEMARVTRPGGRIVILELSEPRRSLIAPFARFHVRTLVPWVGAILSGSREYRYLQRSIAAFPSPEKFGAMMGDAGLNLLQAQALTFGVCHLYVAESPRERL